jgi:predicted O-methyltransferase YrrM
VNATLRRILETETVETPSGDELPLRDHISSEEGEFLQALVREARPQVTLEVGLAFGVSALFICEALQEVDGTRHITIDPLQEDLWKNAGRHSVQQAGYADLVEFIGEPSELALPRLVAGEQQVDFAFIDGAHHFDHALLDFFYIDRLLRPGGVVVFDDASLPSVHRVCRFVLTNRRYSVRACLPSADPPPRRRSLVRLVGRLPSAHRALKPSLVTTDQALGLAHGSRCVAFTKEGADDRDWDFHDEF